MNFKIVSAYRQLSPQERAIVDMCVEVLEDMAMQSGEPISSILGQQITLPPTLAERQHDMLTRPLVISAITERVLAIAQEQELTHARIAKEFRCIAHSNMHDFLDFDEHNNPTFDLTKATPDQWRAIKSLEIESNGMGLEAATKVKIKIQFWDKIAALRAEAEITGLMDPENNMYRARANTAQADALPAGATAAQAGEAYGKMIEG